MEQDTREPQGPRQEAIRRSSSTFRSASADDVLTPSSQMAPGSTDQTEDGTGRMTEFGNHESIYAFMVLYPELMRIRHGSYLNSKTCMAFFLFALNVLMQVVLTHLTGTAILRDNMEFRQSLLMNAGPLDVTHRRLRSFDKMLRETKPNIPTMAEGDVPRCCRGALCEEDAVHCCAPGVEDGTALSTSGWFDDESKDMTPGVRPAFVARYRAGGAQVITGQGSGESGAQKRAVDDSHNSLLAGNFSSIRRHSVPSDLGGSSMSSRSHTGLQINAARIGDAHASEPKAGVHRRQRLRASSLDVALPQRPGAGAGAAGSSPAAASSSMGTAKTKKRSSDESRIPAKRTSVCIEYDGKYMDCTTPVFSYMDKFRYLDTDGDGVWTRDEAIEDYANMGCVLRNTGLSPQTVFRKLSRSIPKILDLFAPGGNASVPAELRDRQGIPEQYWDFWKGTVVLCNAADEKRCGELVTSGIFTGALGGSKVFQNLDKALLYCSQLLSSTGVCEDVMPVTYRIFVEQVFDKCGSTHFSEGYSYQSPVDLDDVIQVVKVEYEKIGTFEMACSVEFRFFLGLILLIWYINLLGEIQAIVQLADFTWNMPVQEVDAFQTRRLARRIGTSLRNVLQRRGIAQGEEPHNRMRSPRVRSPRGHVSGMPLTSSDGMHTIKGITRPHKTTCAVMVVVRTSLVIYMAFVGTIFILTTYSYADLLMNAVALAFVFELPVFFYMLLLGENEKKQLEVLEPVMHRTFLPGSSATGFFSTTFFWGCIVFPFLCWAIIHWNMLQNTMPIYEALECLCFQRGDRCVTRDFYTQPWWDKYWVKNSWATS